MQQESRVDLRRIEAWDYVLPEDRIARYPLPAREASRLLALCPEPAPPDFSHGQIPDLVGHLRPGDLVVMNESRVLPFRLLGQKPTGASGEVLLLRPLDGDVTTARTWEAWVRPGGKLKPGRHLVISDALTVHIEEGLEGGARRVRLETLLSTEEALLEFGRLPLPPYLNREEEPLDRDRYQTVVARTPGSVAAPTAGLHFTEAILDQIRHVGAEVATVTLHVGPGTFRPVESSHVEDHPMHHEAWQVSPEAAEAIAQTRRRGGRVWAVGTTVVRTLESAADGTGGVRAGSGETDLFIAPGFRFQVVDALLTNFHLPRSTLLMLVAALAGYDRVFEAYRTAVDEGYRFYSYGDAMLILPQE